MKTIQILAPKTSSEQVIGDIALIANRKTLEPFAEIIKTFLRELSTVLLSSDKYARNGDIVALGFWLREKHIASLEKEWMAEQKENSRFSALGVVMHFAPNNVDALFVYSWVCSLLMGNSNVVRLSRRDSDTTKALLVELDHILSMPQFNEIALRNVFITYEHDDDVTAALSQLSDARVIWGGDDSVLKIRRIIAKPVTRDIAFADKQSVAVLNGDELSSTNIENCVSKLWQDLKPYQQMACSSPRMLLWLGSREYQAAFCEKLNALAHRDNVLSNSVWIANEHLVISQQIVALYPDYRVLFRQSICILESESDCHRDIPLFSGNGLLVMQALDSLDEIHRFIPSNCQTLTYWGFGLEALIKQLTNGPITYWNRLVPFGQALHFTPKWDGYDLFTELSNRQVLR